MALIDTLKADRWTHVKAKSPYAVAFATVIGEAEMVAKNKGNAAPTDAEVIKILTSTVEGLKEAAKLYSEKGMEDKAQKAEHEAAALDHYLPSTLSPEELAKAIEDILKDAGPLESLKPNPLGFCMNALRASFAGRYDGKEAAKVIAAAVAGRSA